MDKGRERVEKIKTMREAEAEKEKKGWRRGLLCEAAEETNYKGKER